MNYSRNMAPGNKTLCNGNVGNGLQKRYLYLNVLQTYKFNPKLIDP